MASVITSSGLPLPLNTREDFYYLFYYVSQHPEDTEAKNALNAWVSTNKNVAQWYDQWKLQQEAYDAHSGENAGSDVSGQVSQMGGTLTPESEKYLQDLTSQENTSNAQEYERTMRDTSLLSSAAQLGQLGLSSSNVVQVGGATSNGVGAATTSRLSSSSLRQQKSLETYQARLGLAKQVIGMAGQMASSGIYGHAIGAARHAGAVLAAATAHSGLNVLRSHDGAGNGPLLSGKLADEWSKLPGAY